MAPPFVVRTISWIHFTLCPNIVPVHTLDGDILHKWCVVKYDRRVFPGIIHEESDVYVKCMMCAGENRFFWPQFDDMCWYIADDVLFQITEPENVGSRHVQIQRDLWENNCAMSLRNVQIISGT